MNRIILTIALMLFVFTAKAGEGDDYITVNAGYLYNNTLNATAGFEHEFSYGHAVEGLVDIGNHWQHPTCHAFWRGYYWSGAALYKYRLKRFKNGTLRFRVGPEIGAVRTKFFLGAEVGFEYNYIFPSGIQFSIAQKNCFCFFNGDHFKNGLLIGLKFPIR